MLPSQRLPPKELSHVSHLVVQEGQVWVLSRSTRGQYIHFSLCPWSGQDDK